MCYLFVQYNISQLGVNEVADMKMISTMTKVMDSGQYSLSGVISDMILMEVDNSDLMIFVRLSWISSRNISLYRKWMLLILTQKTKKGVLQKIKRIFLHQGYNFL